MRVPALRVDAHHHLWDLERRAQPWIDDAVLARTYPPDEYEREMRSCGFDGSVVVQNLCEEGETRDLLALASAHPWILGVVGWVDLTGDVGAALTRLRAAPGGERLVGVRHQVQFEEDVDWLTRPDVRRGLAVLGAEGLVFDAVVRPEQLDGVVVAAGEIRGLRWVLDHLGNPAGGVADEEWIAAIDALGGMPHVAAKVSGLGGLVAGGGIDAPVDDVVRHALDSFGAPRLMFGSDWPVCLRTGDLPGTVAAAEHWFGARPDPDRDDIFGRTAIRWYRL